LVDLDKQGPQTGTFWDFIETQVKPEYVGEVIKLFAEAENFFKHADRDSDKTLEFPLGTPELFLWECVIKFPELAGEEPLLMHIYRVWFMIHHADILKGEIRERVKSLGLSTDFPESDRVRFFEYALPILAKKVISKKG
jgi:hypothetical protein